MIIASSRNSAISGSFAHFFALLLSLSVFIEREHGRKEAKITNTAKRNERMKKERVKVVRYLMQRVSERRNECCEVLGATSQVGFYTDPFSVGKHCPLALIHQPAKST